MESQDRWRRDMEQSSLFEMHSFYCVMLCQIHIHTISDDCWSLIYGYLIKSIFKYSIVITFLSLFWTLWHKQQTWVYTKSLMNKKVVVSNMATLSYLFVFSYSYKKRLVLKLFLAAHTVAWLKHKKRLDSVNTHDFYPLLWMTETMQTYSHVYIYIYIYMCVYVSIFMYV